MKLQPIIKKKVELFKAEKGYEGVDDNKIFELFVNHHILYAEQPDKFFGNSDILDLVTVGGNNDMGMDGIAIMVNDSLISSKEDFDYLLENTKKIKIRFIFIQAKSGTDADSGEFSKFITGIKDFLQNERPIQPYNQKIEYILNIKNYIMKDEFISTWKEEPTLDIFFMTMGEHSSLPHIEAYKEIFSGEIGKGTTYKDVNFNIFGSKDLKSLCDSNENSFDVTFSYIQNMSLNEVGNVDDSCVILCQGNEFIKLLLNNNGYIRRTIFNDNVRDFQGNTHINNEIGKTIKVDPEKFVLLNNGVTIVCDKFIQKNRSIMVSNPQIVNGCQSSSMLYRAYKEGCDISRVPILVKIISTIDQSVTNQIVRSTNRQNIVYEEAFEITRHFHKNLEDFFGSQSVGNKQFFYERRARQFMNNESIRQDQKVSFKNIIQSSVSMFFHRPDIVGIK